MTETTIETDAVTIIDDMPKPAQEVATVDTALPPATMQPTAMVAQIMELASKENVSPEMFDRLVAWQERERLRQAEEQFDEALEAMQAEIPQVSRLGIVDLNKKGEPYDPKRKYNFARLEDIDEVVRPIMHKYGFSVTYDRVQRSGENGGLVITGTLSRRGVKRVASFPLPLDSGHGRNNLQAAGSTDHYGKRYILEGFLNIVRKGKDDDGNTADPLLKEEIEDLLELLSRTRTAPLPFLHTMVGEDFDLGTDPEHPDPVSLLAQVQRKDFNRLHKVLTSKQAQQSKKKPAGEGEAL